MQLMQQIAEMRVEMQRRQDLPLQDLLLTSPIGSLQSTSLPQIWIQLRTSRLHLFRILRLRSDYPKPTICFSILPNSISSSKQPSPNATPSSKYSPSNRSTAKKSKSKSKSKCFQSLNTPPPFKSEIPILSPTHIITKPPKMPKVPL